MAKIVDPETYGLNKRTVLEKEGKTLYLVIRRKSRIIMADGRKIIEKLDAVRKVDPDLRVGLKVGAPLCSKTHAYLQERGINVTFLPPER